MSEHYLPDKWIKLAKEAMKSHASKEELDKFLKRAAEERKQIRKIN